MRTNHVIFTAAFLAIFSCGQAGESPAPAQAAGPTHTPVPAAPDTEEDAVPSAKFGDGARAFGTVRDTLLRNYYAEGLTEDDLYRAATAGMLEKLEPKMKSWNKLLSPAEIAELKNDLKGEVVGIGVHISFDSATGYADVLAALPGSPSEKAGIVAGDLIVTVNGKLYKGMRLRDVVSDIRGKAGDTVTLSVLRAGKLLTFTVPRGRVTYDQPLQFVLSDGVGYVRVPSFNEKTPGQVKEALDALGKTGVKSLVVDLRNNPGGSFDHAVATADLFLPKDAGIVVLKKRQREEQKYVAKGTGVMTTLPLAVLTCEGTGSSAELMAAALQEGRHATVVGQHTLGKWSVQSLDELPNGYAFKYTVSLFKSPSGRSFEGKGLSPDVEVAMSEKELARANSLPQERRLEVDVQLKTAKELLTRRP